MPRLPTFDAWQALCQVATECSTEKPSSAEESVWDPLKGGSLFQDLSAHMAVPLLMPLLTLYTFFSGEGNVLDPEHHYGVPGVR